MTDIEMREWLEDFAVASGVAGKVHLRQQAFAIAERLAALQERLQEAERERDDHKASAESALQFFHTVGKALAPPETKSFTDDDVLKWVAFTKLGLEVANDGLGVYRRRADAAEARLDRMREGIAGLRAAWSSDNSLVQLRKALDALLAEPADQGEGEENGE